MNKKSISTFIVLCIILSSMYSLAVFAKTPLDEIQNITIDAKTTSDGIVVLDYYFEWKILDSISEGPLNWVQIGVPNDTYDITGFGGDAISAQRYNSKGESKVRLDLSRDFSEGETAKFYFSINVYNLIQTDGNNNWCDFVPGWFDDIAVKSIIVRWQPDNVVSANCQIPGEYIWSGSLKAGQHFETVTTQYGSNIVPIKFDDSRYGETSLIDGNTVNDGNKSSEELFFFVLIVIVSVVIMILRLTGVYSGYRGGRGFPGVIHGGGSHSGCAGCACAGCACACACAGGGRAGCNKKDFTEFRAIIK